MIKKIKNRIKKVFYSKKKEKSSEQIQDLKNTQFHLRYIKIGEELKYFRIPKN